jgi:hypothetical protein
MQPLERQVRRLAAAAVVLLCCARDPVARIASRKNALLIEAKWTKRRHQGELLTRYRSGRRLD